MNNAKQQPGDHANRSVERSSEPRRWVLASYLQLFRLPNVFTALADVMMGFLFVHSSLSPLGLFLFLALASGLLYLAGMVLNDVWDIEQDERDRPERPIPSGAIALTTARRIGFGLWAAGLLCGWAAGLIGLDEPAWRSGLIATALAGCILLYDIGLKHSPLGPLVMGTCRALNVLLGMSAAVLVGPLGVLGFSAVQWLVAGAIGTYIAGVTWLARTESRTSGRGLIAVATLVMMCGIALLGLVHRWLLADGIRPRVDEQTWFLLLGLIGFFIVRRCARAVSNPSPQRVQWAVTTAIWSLIVLDAAIVLLTRYPGWSILIIGLLVPTVALGQWLKST